MATSDPRTDGNESSKPSRFLGIKNGCMSDKQTLSHQPPISKQDMFINQGKLFIKKEGGEVKSI